MKRCIGLLVLFGIFLFFLFFSLKSHAAFVATEDDSCKADLYSVIKQIRAEITKEKPGYVFSPQTLGGVNDIRCEEPENMANIWVILHHVEEDSYSQPLLVYKMFHVHWTQDGTLRPLKNISDGWNKSPDLHGLLKDMCSFYSGINIYKDDWEIFGCQQFAPWPE